MKLKKTGGVDCLKKKRKKERKKDYWWRGGSPISQTHSWGGGGVNGGALLIINNIFLFISYSFLVICIRFPWKYFGQMDPFALFIGDLILNSLPNWINNTLLFLSVSQILYSQCRYIFLYNYWTRHVKHPWGRV